jgi:hypothetical protein
VVEELMLEASEYEVVEKLEVSEQQVQHLVLEVLVEIEKVQGLEQLKFVFDFVEAFEELMNHFVAFQQNIFVVFVVALMKKIDGAPNGDFSGEKQTHCSIFNKKYVKLSSHKIKKIQLHLHLQAY